MNDSQKWTAFLAVCIIAAEFEQPVRYHDRIDGMLIPLPPVLPWGPKS